MRHPTRRPTCGTRSGARAHRAAGERSCSTCAAIAGAGVASDRAAPFAQDLAQLVRQTPQLEVPQLRYVPNPPPRKAAR